MYIVSVHTNTPFGSFLSAIHIAMLQLSRPELQDSEEFGAALVCSHPCSPSCPPAKHYHNSLPLPAS